MSALVEGGGTAALRDVNKRGLTPLAEALAAGHTNVASLPLLEVVLQMVTGTAAVSKSGNQVHGWLSWCLPMV